MFYIKLFFQFIMKYPIRSGLYLLFTFLIMLSCLFWPNLRTSFWNHYAENPIYPYFYVILNGTQDPESFKTKLISMPNVVNIELKTKDEIKEKMMKVFQDTGIPQDALEINASALKIYIDTRGDSKGIELIRDYLKRSSLNEDIMMTPLEQDIVAQKMYKNNIIPQLKKWGEIFIASTLFCLWALCFSLFLNPLRKMSYLIENYQRKKRVASKILGISLILILTLIALPLSFFIWPSIPGLIGVALFMGIISLYPLKGNYEYAEKN